MTSLVITLKVLIFKGSPSMVRTSKTHRYQILIYLVLVFLTAASVTRIFWEQI